MIEADEQLRYFARNVHARVFKVDGLDIINYLVVKRRHIYIS